jgi:hypothetical protein
MSACKESNNKKRTKKVNRWYIQVKVKVKPGKKESKQVTHAGEGKGKDR